LLWNSLIFDDSDGVLAVKTRCIGYDWVRADDDVIDGYGAARVGRGCCSSSVDRHDSPANRLAVAGLDTSRLDAAILLNADGVGVWASPKAQNRRDGGDRRDDPGLGRVFHNCGRVALHIVWHTFLALRNCEL